MQGQPQATVFRRRLGTFLHCFATGAYVVFLFSTIQVVLELWKGFELLPYIKDYWISFGGAREVVSIGLVSLVVGRLIDVYSKRLNPVYARARGWTRFDW